MSSPEQPRGLRRLLGLDRSAPAPAETLPGSPLRPFTIPNAIGYIRIALLAAFVWLVATSGDGTSTVGAVLYGLTAAGDYLDGIAARLTGQYSRLGALLDPLIDRAMVIIGAASAWYFELLPPILLLLLVIREVAMLVLARWALRRRGQIVINWIGRIGVWPTMAALFLAIAGAPVLATVLLAIGLVLAYLSSVLYAEALFRPRSGAA